MQVLAVVVNSLRILFVNARLPIKIDDKENLRADEYCINNLELSNSCPRSLVSASLFRVRHYEQSLRITGLLAGCINLRCHLDMTNGTGISYEKSNGEHEKLNFHSLPGERRKNRIKASEFEFMRLRCTCCQIASGVDLSPRHFIPLSFLVSPERRERESWLPVYHIPTSTRNNVGKERRGGRGYNSSRTEGWTVAWFMSTYAMDTCLARDQSHALACASCLQK